VSEKVAVIGSQTAKDLFGSIDPVGRVIRIGRHQYRVLGVLEEKGPSPFGQSQDEIVLIPITTMRSHILVTRPFEVHAIMMSATSGETTERAASDERASGRAGERAGERASRRRRAELSPPGARPALLSPRCQLFFMRSANVPNFASRATPARYCW
jgi:hypothetical protein